MAENPNITDILLGMHNGYRMFRQPGGSPAMQVRFRRISGEYLAKDTYTEDAVFNALTHVWHEDMSDLETYGVRTEDTAESWDFFAAFRDECYRTEFFDENVLAAAKAFNATF